MKNSDGNFHTSRKEQSFLKQCLYHLQLIQNKVLSWNFPSRHCFKNEWTWEIFSFFASFKKTITHKKCRLSLYPTVALCKHLQFATVRWKESPYPNLIGQCIEGKKREIHTTQVDSRILSCVLVYDYVSVVYSSAFSYVFFSLFLGKNIKLWLYNILPG